MKNSELRTQNSERIAYYSANAAQLAEQYNKLNRKNVHAATLHFYETAEPLQILDAGCGSGADAKWLASEYNHHIVAFEPSALFDLAVATNAHPNIEYIRDSLPGLETLRARHQQFDLVLSSAVLQELDEPSRAEALQTLISLTKPGGRILISYPSPPSRQGQHYVPDDEILASIENINLDPAFKNGGTLELSSFNPDTTGRKAFNSDKILTFQQRVIQVYAKDPVQIAPPDAKAPLQETLANASLVRSTSIPKPHDLSGQNVTKL